jgi:hypothetical protein
MSLLNTLMQELRSGYSNRFDENELRESKYGAYQLFKQSADSPETSIFDEETRRNILNSYGNTVEVPVLDAETVTVTTPYVRSCSIVDDENNSAIVSLSFAAYGWAFSMHPANHYNNDIDMISDFTRKVMKYVLQYAADLDSLCLAQLNTDRNQLWTDIAPAFYAQVGNALQVPQAEKNDFYNKLEAIMNQMDFYDQVSVVANSIHMPLVRRLDNQGSSNATNEGFQFDLRGYEWYPTNRQGNAAGVESTGFAVERGSVGIYNRNDADAVIGQTIQGGSKIWGQELVPVVDQVMGTFFQEDCADVSGIAGAASAGLTRSLKQGYEWSTDILVASKYNSDPVNRYSPIVKFEILQ